MKKHGWTWRRALVLLQDRRPIVLPNPGFVRQLHVFQTKLGIAPDPDDERYFEAMEQAAARRETADALAAAAAMSGRPAAAAAAAAAATPSGIVAQAAVESITRLDGIVSAAAAAGAVLAVLIVCSVDPADAATAAAAATQTAARVESAALRGLPVDADAEVAAVADAGRGTVSLSAVVSVSLKWPHRSPDCGIVRSASAGRAS
jgi:hypothetical protein